jgi:c(7)-type cytochrome triheme protein
MKSIIIGMLSVLLMFSFAGAKVGGGDIVFKETKTGSVIFSHNSHVEGIGLKCTDCHDALFTTKAKHKKVSMAQMQKGQSCGACHNGGKAFSIKDSCKNCHKK